MESKNIDNVTFVEMVGALQKPGIDILRSLTPLKCELLHHAYGMAGEYLEFELALKNNDYENMKEEAGDFLFYAQGYLLKLKELQPSLELRPILTIEGVIDTDEISVIQHLDVVLDVTKKYIFYSKDVDDVTFIPDATFMRDTTRKCIYLIFAICKHIADLNPDDLISANKAKLAKRYENYIYTDEAAKRRADKDE